MRIALALVALGFGQAAAAQVTTAYIEGTDGNINNATTCSAPLVRNFTVGTSYVVGDVDIGVFVTHTWRGDLRMTLQAPDGTRVQIVNGDTTNAVSGDNFNVRLNDSGTQAVNSDSATAAHSTTAPPPFANNFIPNNPLSAFSGKNSLGTWRLEVCDIYPSADNGTFRHAELYLTSAPASYADLSLAKTVSTATPIAGATITYTLQLTNASAAPTTATGITVTDLLPAGVSYVSHSGFGTYNPSTGLWTVGTVAPGQTRSLSIQATVTAMASATVVNIAEVSASGVQDLDSTPGNGNSFEDDYAAVSFTVQGTRSPGIPPTLTCPAGSSLFDWDLNPWPANSLANSYSLTNIGTIGFSIASTGTWTGSPVLNGSGNGGNNGGLAGSQLSLFQSLDFATASEIATTTITLPTAVPGVQFRVFDVDYAANDFADRLTVTGSFNGTPVAPTLTNGATNYVIGNSAYGDTGNSTATSGDGNVVVTFSSPVDTIVIVYGNHSSVPAPAANPDGQAISIWDITLCNPVAVLGVTKVSTLISDPTNGTTNPRAIPGAVMEYCILVQNPGSGTATNVVGTDTIPATLTYVAGSITSGSTCGTASTAEDDDAAGADEADPFGASIAGAVLTATAPTLGPSSGFALKFRTTIK